MYCTNITKPWPNRHEKNSGLSIVDETVAVKMSAKISQFLATSLLMQASRFGYDYRLDEDLPENFNFQNFREMDIIDRMDILNHVHDKIKQYKQDQFEGARDASNEVASVQNTGGDKKAEQKGEPVVDTEGGAQS